MDRITKRKFLQAMQQLIYPEPIVTSREQKTFENYLNIDDKSIMVQDTAVDVAYPDYFGVNH